MRRKKNPTTWSSLAAVRFSDKPVLVFQSNLQSELTGLICLGFPDAEVISQHDYIITPPNREVNLNINPLLAW